MLDTYKTLTQNGVIGPMMKVGTDGKPIVDPTGQIPGNLVARPFQEFPKVVRRARADGTILERTVGSKSEELRLIAEAPDEVTFQSPLEKERDELARTVAEQDKALSAQQAMLEKMASQMTNLMAQMEKLTGGVPNDLPPVVNQPATTVVHDAETRATATKGFGAINS
jgi:uncharacterized coiled-coil protein SlyX